MTLLNKNIFMWKGGRRQGIICLHKMKGNKVEMANNKKVRVAIVGIGLCSAALIQGLLHPSGIFVFPIHARVVAEMQVRH